MSCSELLSKVGLSLRTATLGKRRAFDRVIEENEQWMHEDIENIKQMCNQFRQRAAAPVSDEQQLSKPLQPIALSSSQQPSAIAAQPASADSLVKVKSALADLQQRRERERAEKEAAAQAAAAIKQAELAAALLKEKEKQEALEAAEAQRRKEEEARSLAQAEQKRAAAALAAAEQAAETERQRIAAAAAEKQARDEERKRVQAAQAAAAEQGRRIAEKQAAEAAAAEAAAVALAKQREEEQQAAARAAAAAAESARAKAAAAQSEREAATLAKEREVARLAAEVEEAQRASLEAREKRMREKFAQLGAQEKAKQQQQQQQIQQQQQQQQHMEMPPPAHLPSHVSNAVTPKGKHSSAQISPLRPPSGASAAAAFPVPAAAAAAAPVPRNPADSYELSDVEIWSEDEEAEEARRASRKPLPREFDELGHEVERSDDGKLIPKWAWKGYLKQRLDQMQRAKMDPDLVFPPVDPASCDLEAIFAPITPLRKRKPRGRTSSAHWQKDRLNQKEADKYQTAMGYRR
jgi:hypothetical protein